MAALTKGPGVLARDAALLAGAPVRVEVTVTQLAKVAKVGLVRRKEELVEEHCWSTSR